MAERTFWTLGKLSATIVVLGAIQMISSAVLVVLCTVVLHNNIGWKEARQTSPLAVFAVTFCLLVLAAFSCLVSTVGFISVRSKSATHSNLLVCGCAVLLVLEVSLLLALVLLNIRFSTDPPTGPSHCRPPSVDMKQAMADYGNDSRLTTAIDQLQQEHQCCGYRRPVEWLQTTWAASCRNQSCSLPLSCCHFPFELLLPNGSLSRAGRTADGYRCGLELVDQSVSAEQVQFPAYENGCAGVAVCDRPSTAGLFRTRFLVVLLIVFVVQVALVGVAVRFRRDLRTSWPAAGADDGQMAIVLTEADVVALE